MKMCKRFVILLILLINLCLYSQNIYNGKDWIISIDENGLFKSAPRKIERIHEINDFGFAISIDNKLYSNIEYENAEPIDKLLNLDDVEINLTGINITWRNEDFLLKQRISDDKTPGLVNLTYDFDYFGNKVPKVGFFIFSQNIIDEDFYIREENGFEKKTSELYKLKDNNENWVIHSYNNAEGLGYYIDSDFPPDWFGFLDNKPENLSYILNEENSPELIENEIFNIFCFKPVKKRAIDFSIRFGASGNEIICEAGELPLNIPTDVISVFDDPQKVSGVALIRFELPNEMKVSLEIFDMMGKRVATIFDDKASTGINAIDWDGNDDYGSPMPAGFYSYNISSTECNLAAEGMLMLR